jgi:cyanobactin maturation PatA/PatG family protease
LETTAAEPRVFAAEARAEEAPVAAVRPSAFDEVTLSDCGCGCGGAGKETCGCGGKKATQLVYALGRIGYDFGTEARRDSFAQMMGATANPYDPAQMASYIAANPYEAESLIWTLNLDATPIYAIVPIGPFAPSAHERLRQAFAGQLDAGVELVSIPGTIGGSARLISGQVVPVIVPAVRGIFSWGTKPLIDSIIGEEPADENGRTAHRKRVAGLGNFLSRVYYDLRNLGVTASERALNYAASNAFQAAQVMQDAAQGDLELDTIAVKKSPVCRPDSDCYDIEIAFFDPRDQRVANKIYRFTVDVSDIMPVTIGSIRSWRRRG